MNREKQIEEMAGIIATSTCIGIYCSECEFNEKPPCNQMYKAAACYNAGYRKASEVAEEIFAELKKVMIDEYRYPIIAELKKKYIQSEDTE